MFEKQVGKAAGDKWKSMSEKVDCLLFGIFVAGLSWVHHFYVLCSIFNENIQNLGESSLHS